MNKLFIGFLLLSACSLSSGAASYPVGTLSTIYADMARSNRSIPVEIHYPAISTGSNTGIAAGAYPFVVFGHGFQMTAAAYYPFADSLAMRGYIVAFANTENSFSPSHTDFAKDLLYIYNALIAEGANSSSPFYGHVVARGAIAGHSMGGGATVLSAQYGDSATCYFTLAEATTNPSSISAAQYLTKPYLSFAGSYDCIAPYSTNQLPTYNATASACKTLIELTGASHCNFGLSNTQCSIGETFSGCANPPLSRSAQINTVLGYLYPYLDHYLYGSAATQVTFDSIYDSDAVNIRMSNCISPTGVQSISSGATHIYPIPVRTEVHIDLNPGEAVRLCDLQGLLLHDWTPERVIDLSQMASGIYVVHIRSASGEVHAAKIIKE